MSAARSTRPQDEKYTDPELRERLKTEITDGDRGGRPGQWSARKAQLLAHEYEKAGGGYSQDKDADQQHLSQWTEQEWTTQDGSASAGEKRYLPREAWDDLTPAQRREADATKAAGTRAGNQHVDNPAPAREAGRRARAHDGPHEGALPAPFADYDDLTVDDVVHRLRDLDLDDHDAQQLVRDVTQHERAGKGRRGVLRAAERLLSTMPR